ncbi:hybrid sensor histidine kinase/response regulator [Methyloterricola oryzae]|uniref:hybrid sensor histidine kinase/response regulator n=1 Tax=Methyloterricola oryzae TaxID=1495050 RepID=UPI0009E20B5D|nr:PAS domain S-box protein [Methyloterricola oryzae]
MKSINACWSSPFAARLAAALAILLIALLLRLTILPYDAGYSFFFFYPPIAIAFLLCGSGPGAVVTALSAIASLYCFVPPYFQWLLDADDGIACAIFLAASGMTGLFVGQYRHLFDALQTVERRYSRVLEAQSEFIGRFKADGTIVYVNEAFRRFFGTTGEPLVGHSWRSLAFKDDLPWINEMLSRLSPENPDVTIENCVIAANGELRWGQFASHATFDQAGSLSEIQIVGRDISERKEAEIALQQSEQTLQMAQAVGRIGSFAMGHDTETFTCSKETARLFDLDVNGVTTFAEWFARVHPDDQGAVETAWRAALQGAPYDMTYRIVVRGQIVWIRAMAKLTFDDAGQLLSAIGTVQDITDRVQATEKIRESEQRLNAFLQHSSTVAWLKDEMGRHVFLSPNFAKRFGIRQEDWIGKTDFDIWPVEVAEQFRKNDQAVLESGESLEMVEKACSSDGTISWWRSSKFSFSDPSGKRYVGGLGIDITEIKETERRLIESEVRFRTLFESAQDGILLAEKQSRRFVAANPAMCALLGYSQEELLSLGVADIHPAEQLPYVIQEFDSFARGKSRQLDDIRILRKDGTERLVSIVPAFMETTGQPLLAGLFRDVTERHRQEAALRDADRRKDEFLATLSHELRNPLAPIKIGVGVLRLAKGDPKTVARILDIFDTSLSHLIRLVDDLLDISRITTGKIHLQVTAVDLATVIQRAVDLSLPFIKEAGLTLQINLPETSIRLNADLTRLGQAFANLLNNAAKFTPRGGQITVTAEQRSDTVVVRVLDNGIGIPAAMLTHIFDRFTQVDGSLEKEHGGLGIGLSLVKDLITLHDGTVEARSEGGGKGSEFIVCLPCEPPRSAVPEHQNDQDLESTRPDPRRILICDDNVLVTTTLTMHFATLGHQIAIACDGLEAVKLAESFHPELILMDIGMPNLNGYDACRQIRQQPWGRDLFIAALTGWDSDPDRQKADEAGFDRYLVKPVDTVDLDRLIEELSLKRAG